MAVLIGILNEAVQLPSPFYVVSTTPIHLRSSPIEVTLLNESAPDMGDPECTLSPEGALTFFIVENAVQERRM